MECRLHETPLAQMKAVFAGKQPIAQHRARALHYSTLMVIARVRNQHVLRHVGMKEYEDLAPCGTIADQVSVSPVQLFHVEQRIAAHRKEWRQGQQWTWPWSALPG